MDIYLNSVFSKLWYCLCWSMQDFKPESTWRASDSITVRHHAAKEKQTQVLLKKKKKIYLTQSTNKSSSLTPNSKYNLTKYSPYAWLGSCLACFTQDTLGGNLCVLGTAQYQRMYFSGIVMYFAVLIGWRSSVPPSSGDNTSESNASLVWINGLIHKGHAPGKKLFK